MKKAAFLWFAVLVLPAMNAARGQVQILDAGWHHLRNNGPREWSTFAEKADKDKLQVHFRATPNTVEKSLSVRQHDVKLNWSVVLNGEPLGALVADENDLVTYFAIPPAVLRGDNTLEIACKALQPDDIKAGHIRLYDRPVNQVLSEGTLDIEIVDADDGQRIPGRITITNVEGTLQQVTGISQDPMAIRPGCVYTGNGKASIGLPEGTYRIYGGRGFEYGVDSAEVIITKGTHAHQKLSIRRDVPTTGWVSSDTHIHTFTWSGHGDATAAERVLTVAGEGVELPILTDHNIQTDLAPLAAALKVAPYFTPVTGNEVTTSVGHFNIFPLAAGKAVIGHGARNWKALAADLGDLANSKAVILNHARDIHATFRPFDPSLHLSSAGMRLDGWEFPANAMEVINSGAQQTDQLELMRDWFGMLNGGHFTTPVGSSDSHDVSRYIVGQARTYIRCNDDDPSSIDVQEAVRNFREGNVMVSFGLLTEIEINNTYGPGELAPGADEIHVSVSVSGPAWVRAERVTLYANGIKIREERIANGNVAGIKWNGHWTLMTPRHDVFLVAVAEGPDPRRPFWPIAKPYQPASTDWAGGVIGLSGAVWVDGDRNERRDAAFSYAESLYRQASGDLAQLVRNLAAYDEAVAIQVAALLHKKGTDLRSATVAETIARAAPETKSGFETVIRELQLPLK